MDQLINKWSSKLTNNCNNNYTKHFSKDELKIDMTNHKLKPLSKRSKSNDEIKKIL